MTPRNGAEKASVMGGYSLGRSNMTSIAYRILLCLTYMVPVYARPTMKFQMWKESSLETDPDDIMFYPMVFLSIFLCILGGVFAGLTIALMGQDMTNLRVLQESGTQEQQKHARKVLSLLNRGKHWVLVTLLLGNVITNETLPIVTDALLGGGWPAIMISTVAVVIFGEIIPQAASVRYGLLFGAYCTPLVLALMYLLYPITYPTALLLDSILGKDEGVYYHKAGLKALVFLHKSLGVGHLNDDEVTIISAVLDLREKPVGRIMTPIGDVYTLPSDRILDEATINEILCAGYSRIPIYVPEEPHNFIGMLLVKTLITYDPDDRKPVSEFELATLPETRADTSCLDILNFFQEGKSHMALVSSHPGLDHGAQGVVTLEDVIEELIGEEIVDETDVFVDVHKHLRRMVPSQIVGRRMQNKIFKRVESVDNTLMAPAIGPKNPARNPRFTLNSKVTIKDNSNVSSSLSKRQNTLNNDFTTGSVHSSHQTIVQSPDRSSPIDINNNTLEVGSYSHVKSGSIKETVRYVKGLEKIVVDIDADENNEQEPLIDRNNGHF